MTTQTQLTEEEAKAALVGISEEETEVKTIKSNATLAKQLKDLGFNRDVFNKSQFTKRIHSDDRDGEQIRIDVRITNTWEGNWFVREIKLTTQSFTEQLTIRNSIVELGSNALTDLAFTLTKLKEL